MWKAIKYLFYKSYKFYKYEMGDKNPHITSLFVVVWLLGFFIFSFFNFIDLTNKIKPITGAIFGIIFLLIITNILFYKQRWKEIIKEFENESEKQRKKGRILVILFTIFTILLFISSLFYLAFK